MSIAQLFESGEHAKNKGHFSNLVMIARADGKMSEEEMEFLNKMARKIGLNDAQVKEVIEHASSYPTIPPTTIEDRHERFVNFMTMVEADHEVSPKEKQLVVRFGVALGYDEMEIDELFYKVLGMVKSGESRQEIVERLLGKH